MSFGGGYADVDLRLLDRQSVVECETSAADGAGVHDHVNTEAQRRRPLA